ncbi:extracellular solute-binding protein family 5 [Ketogulonicigenium robustum]|uniref:Extracellular solute-binding protein family 5 n=1 Tax=Ketogulonicigenium robustum TaxID=92947 RepID=A0A1W6P1P6_9RHOB|nr:ABC transporter substrate-binding protein [Ketogulonicigenium robustum]ARO15250.1 extracellular solute-binding protein family 5 [Ketogulonicigenium robustum]
MSYHWKTTLSALAIAAAFALPASAQEGRTLVMALSGDVTTLDPHMTASIGTDLSIASHIYPSLVWRGPDMALHANAAESWEAVDDHTWLFHLNPAAKFINGEALDAAAVKANVERVTNPELNSRIASWFGNITEVNVIDAQTVEFKTGTPYPALADQLSMFFLLPPQWMSDVNPALETTSGGPYVMSDRVPGSSITLTANPDYWGPAPQFDRVEIKIIPEDAARVAALRAGEVDFADKIPVSEVASLDAEANLVAGSVPATRTTFLKINTEKPPMDSLELRQALNYAVDKEAITDALFEGMANVANCQILTSQYFGYNPDLQPYPYDPEKAIELLAASGVDLSQPIELEVPVGTYLQGEEVAQAVQSMLMDVGLNVNIVEMSFGAYQDKHIKAHDVGRLSLLSYAWPTIDADGLLGLAEAGNPYDFWGNSEFSEYLHEGRATTDPAERQAAYDKATELMCEQAPFVFLYEQPVTYATSTDVHWNARGDDWKRAMDFDAE